MYEEFKALLLNYGTYEQPIPIALGFEFRGSVQNIKDFQKAVMSLNSEGWHYRDVPIVIQGNQYSVAQIFVEDKPITEVIKSEYCTDPNLINNLAQYFLTMDMLGIPQNLRTYTKVKPQQEVMLNKSKNTGTNYNKLYEKYSQYLKPEEIGNLSELTPEEFEELENLYEERKLEAIQKQETGNYELPPSLQQYTYAYREAYLKSTVQVDNEEKKKVFLHELGLKNVVRAMLVEIPNLQTNEVSDDEFESNFKELGKYTHILQRDLEFLKINSIEMEAESIFMNIVREVIDEIKITYGSYENFLQKFVEMPLNSRILQENKVATSSAGEIEYSVIKSMDSVVGEHISFVTQVEGNQVIFPIALWELVKRTDVTNQFARKYNALLAPFFVEIGKSANVELLKLHTHEVYPVLLRLIGTSEDEDVGIPIYLFQYQQNSDNYCVLYQEATSNYLLGSVYPIIGDNFKINYKGKKVYVVPTGSQETKAVVDDLINQKVSSRELQEICPGYYEFALEEEQNVTNLNLRKAIQNFDSLLQATLNAGYNQNYDASITEQDVQIKGKDQPIVITNESSTTFSSSGSEFEQPVDIFKEFEVADQMQYHSTAEEQKLNSPTTQEYIRSNNSADQVSQVMATEQSDNSWKNELTKITSEIEELYAQLDEKSRIRLIRSIEGLIDVYRA